MFNVALRLLAVTLLGMPASEDFSIQQLVANLKQLERAHSALQTTFIVYRLPNRPIDAKEPWPNEPIQDLERLEWIMDSGLLRIRYLESMDDPADSAAESAARLVSVWTGEAWYDRSSDGKYCRILSEPPKTVRTDCWALFNGIDWPSIVGQQSLSEAVQTSRLVSRSTDGSTTRLRFSRNREGTVELEVVVETEPRLVVRSVVLDVKEAPGHKFAGMLKRRIGFYIDEWAEFDGMLLPKRARRDSAIYRSEKLAAQNIPLQMSRRVFVRESALDLQHDPPSPDVFSAPAYQSGETVGDEALHIIYTVGSRELAVDGFIFETDAPIADHPGRELPKLLKDATDQTALVSAGAEKETQAAKRHDLNKTVAAAVLAFVASLGLLAGIRWFSSRCNR